MKVTASTRAERDTFLGWVALAGWLLTVGAIALTVAAYVARGAPSQRIGFVQGPLGITAVAMTGIMYASVGAFLLRRRSRDAIGWALLGIGVGMAVTLPLNQFIEATLHAFQPVPLGTLLTTWAVTTVHMPLSGVAVVLVVLLFPTGRFDWPWARHAVALAVVGAACLALATALRPEGLLWFPNLPNPLPVPSWLSTPVMVLSMVGAAAFSASLALAAAGLVWRYRHGSARQRRQLAWVALGAAAMASCVAALYVGRYVGMVAGSEADRLALVGAIGAALLPLAMLRFATVTASLGQETRDVTFLFTDLQDSTAMYDRIGDEFAFDLVRLHFDTLTAVTRHHRGTIVKTIGDALMARFLDPTDAVRAALEMFARLERFNRRHGTQLALKVGLHRGDAIIVRGRSGTDYFGQTVNIAARIGGVAQPGEIALSDAVRGGGSVADLLAPCELRTERVTLKGVTDEVIIHRLAPPPPSGG